MSVEKDFWALAPIADSRGIGRSQMGQLAKLCQDFKRAHQILTDALKAKSPPRYLGKVVSNIRAENQVPTFQHQQSSEPEVVSLARFHGWPVRKSVRSNGEPGWWVAGTLYDKEGSGVGG